MTNFSNLNEAVINGDDVSAVREVERFISDGVLALTIINDGLLTGMTTVGEKFRDGEMFVPEVLMAARAMNAAMDIVKPLLVEGDVHSLGTVVIGTVKGDLHDIGKNLVIMMLESAGFHVINLGTDVSKEQFVEAAKEHKADIVAMSAMLTTTMTYMNDIIEACKEAGIEANYMVGGAPLTPMYAEKISAVYTADASGATYKAKELLS